MGYDIRDSSETTPDLRQRISLYALQDDDDELNINIFRGLDPAKSIVVHP